jgi:hypothetical protein
MPRATTPRDILADAEHEQQIGGFYRRADQMRCVDLGDLSASLGNRLRRSSTGSPRVAAGTGIVTMAGIGRIAKSLLIAVFELGS